MREGARKHKIFAGRRQPHHRCSSRRQYCPGYHRAVGFSEIMRALGRRWYVVVLGVLLTLGGGYYVFTNTSPEYTARALVLLIPSESPDAEPGSNPLLNLGGLDLTARVLVATYSSTAFAEEIAAVSPDAEVVVAVDEATRGPVIAIHVTARSEQEALDVLERVADDVPARLAALQQEVGVGDDAAVHSVPLTTDTHAETEYQAMIRMLVVVVVGGIAVTAAIALLSDVLVRRRNR